MALGKLLVAIDIHDPEGSAHLIETTRSLIAATAADVHLLYVTPTLPTRYSRYLRTEFAADVRAEGLRELTKWAGVLDRPEGTVSMDVRQGAVATEVLAQTAAQQADMILVGAHKFGLIERLIGSNATAIIRDSPRNVFVVKHSA